MEGGEQDPPTLLSWSCLLYCYFEYVHLSSTYLSWLEIWIYILLIMLAQLVKNLPAMQETQYSWTSLVARLVNNMPAMRETGVWSLGWEDPLEKGKATHSSFLGWRIPWTIKSMGSQSQTQLSGFHFTFTFIHSLIVHLLDMCAMPYVA